MPGMRFLSETRIETQGIGYIYIKDEYGELLARTFVPGIADEIGHIVLSSAEAIVRHIPGFGDFLEVNGPILDGVAGSVHIGMNSSLIALKVQRAVGQQAYLISSIFMLGVLCAVWRVHPAAKPLGALTDYAAALARERDGSTPDHNLLRRPDEVGQLAKLLLYFSKVMDPRKPIGTPLGAPA